MPEDYVKIKSNSRRCAGLQTKLGIAFSGLVIITSAILTFALFMTARRELRVNVREHVREITDIAALQIDSAAHASLIDRSQEDSADYLHIKWALQKIRKCDPHIRYIYTWRFNDSGQLVFVVDAETDPDKISHIGDVYHCEDETALLRKLANAKGPLSDEEFSVDQWGVWLSGYAPFYGPDGRREGILGIDISAADIIAQEEKYWRTALFAFGCTIPLAMMMGWLLGFKLTQPIKKLTAASERIACGDLNYRVDLHCSNEIGKLSSSFNRMAQKLQDEIVARGKEIVERKHAQKRLAELNKELGDTVDKLSTANRDLEDLAYVAAHDLKAPVRAIGSLAGIMSLDYSDKLDEEGKRMLGLLAGRSQRMTELLNALLNYSEIGRVVYKKEPVDTNELVQNIIGEITAPGNIEITVENELPVITCVRSHISLVFKNLIVNAVRFMDKPQGQIKISCIEKSGFCQFSVADNGPGIESKYFPKIFKLFQTLNRRDELEATGAGLAIAKKVMDIYNGAIWVESEPGKGSTFFFALPKQQAILSNAAI